MDSKNKNKEMLILTLKTLYHYTKVLFIFVYKSIIFLLSNTNRLLDKTGKKYQILSGLLIAISLFSLKSIYQKEIDLFFFDLKIQRAEAKQQELHDTKNHLKKEYQELMENTVFKKITEFSNTKQDQCIQDNLVSFLKQKRDEWIIVDDYVIELAKIDLKRNECNIERINEEVHKHLVEVPYNDLLLKHKENIKYNAEIENKELEKKAEELENKIFEIESKKQENISDNSSVYQAGFNDEVAKDIVSKNDIKAIFCLHGHGLSQNWKYDDNGAYGYTTNEREAILKNMNKVCDKLRDYYKNKDVKVYEFNDENDKMNLTTRIAKVNEISKNNNLDSSNSVLVELHWNKLATNTQKNWLEVFYSESKNKKNWFNVEFAQRMAYEIKQLKRKSNHYAVKPDTTARWKRIGILSDTIPNSILVEYGFLSNVDDDKEAFDSPEYISDSIFNGIIKYVNK